MQTVCWWSSRRRPRDAGRTTGLGQDVRQPACKLPTSNAPALSQRSRSPGMHPFSLFQVPSIEGVLQRTRNDRAPRTRRCGGARPALRGCEEAVWWFFGPCLSTGAAARLHRTRAHDQLIYKARKSGSGGSGRRRAPTMGEGGQHRFYSILFELRDNRDSHRLVKGAHHAEAALVRVPIEGADRLRGQVLLVQQLEVPGHALRDAVGVLD